MTEMQHLDNNMFAKVIATLTFAKVNATEEFDLLWQIIARNATVLFYCQGASRCVSRSVESIKPRRIDDSQALARF